MNPLVGAAIISGGASLLGGTASAAASAKASKEAVEAQIAWERERALNAHQWEVQDLIKAGLNPILSAGGSGATTGGISAPVPDTSGYTKAGEGIGNAVSTALDAKRLQNETAIKDIQIIKGQTEAENIIADTANKMAQRGLITAQTAESLERKGLISKQIATEVSKQALQYAQTYQTDANWRLQQQELNQKAQKFAEELEILKAAKEEAIANKDYAKANAYEKQYHAKHRKFAFWMDQVGKILGGASAGASAGQKGVSAMAIAKSWL